MSERRVFPRTATIGLLLAVMALLGQCSHAWQGGVPSQRLAAASRPLVTSASTSPLFRPSAQRSWRRIHHNKLAMTAEEPEEIETEASEDESVVEGDEEDEKFGVVKTVLLAGPLFVKFSIVLVIKFATDLIVFPLLWLYRLARLTKRKFMKFIGKGQNDYTNGETGP